MRASLRRVMRILVERSLEPGIPWRVFPQPARRKSNEFKARGGSPASDHDSLFEVRARQQAGPTRFPLAGPFARLLPVRRLSLDPLRLLLGLTRRHGGLTDLLQQDLTLDAGQFGGVPELAALLARRGRSHQRLLSVGLPLRVLNADGGAVGYVAPDRRHQIKAAERANVIAIAEEVGPHLVHPELPVAHT